MPNFDVKIDDSGLKRLLKRLTGRLRNLTPVTREIGEIVLESIQRNFQVGGRPRRWRRLSRATIAQRKRIRRWPGKILFRQGPAGGLMGSISYAPGPDRVTLSARKVYAAVHQFGARRGEFGRVLATVRQYTRKDGVTVRAHTRRMLVPWGTIPARPFMVVQTGDWAEIKHAVGNYLRRA